MQQELFIFKKKCFSYILRFTVTLIISHNFRLLYNILIIQVIPRIQLAQLPGATSQAVVVY